MADLAWVGTTNLEEDAVGTIFPTIFHMPLSISLGPERLLAFWALIV